MGRAGPSGSPGVSWGDEPRTRRAVARAECQTGLSFVDEARPFVEIFVQAAGNTMGETEEYAGSPKEAEQLEER